MDENQIRSFIERVPKRIFGNKEYKTEYIEQFDKNHYRLTLRVNGVDVMCEEGQASVIDEKVKLMLRNEFMQQLITTAVLTLNSRPMYKVQI